MSKSILSEIGKNSLGFYTRSTVEKLLGCELPKWTAYAQMCNQSNGGAAYLDITQLIMAEYNMSSEDVGRLSDYKLIKIFESLRGGDAKQCAEQSGKKEEMFRVGEIIDIISQEQLSKKTTKEQRKVVHDVNDTMKGVIKKFRRGKYYALIRLTDGTEVLSCLYPAQLDELKVGMKVHCKHSPSYGWIIYDTIA